MSDLKPCPYCGAGEATDNNNASFSGVELMAAGTDRPYVWCGTCCASARMADTEAEAIAAWNTRTLDPATIRESALRAAADAVSNLGREFADGGSPTAMKVLDLASDRILAALDLSPTAVDASQTPDPVVNEHDDPVCTCCGGTGITFQTERLCACQTPDPVLSDPRVKALVEALRRIEEGHPAGTVQLGSREPVWRDCYRDTQRIARAALRAIWGEA